MIFNENGEILNEKFNIFNYKKNRDKDFVNKQLELKRVQNQNTQSKSVSKSFKLTEEMSNEVIKYFKSVYSKIALFTKRQIANLVKSKSLDKNFEKYFKIYQFNEEDGWEGTPTGTIKYDDSYFVSPDKYKTHKEWSMNIYRWWFNKDAILMCKLEDPIDDDNIEYEDDTKIDNIQNQLIEDLFAEAKKYNNVYVFEADDCTGIYIGIRLIDFFNISE